MTEPRLGTRRRASVAVETGEGGAAINPQPDSKTISHTLFAFHISGQLLKKTPPLYFNMHQLTRQSPTLELEGGPDWQWKRARAGAINPQRENKTITHRLFDFQVVVDLLPKHATLTFQRGLGPVDMTEPHLGSQRQAKVAAINPQSESKTISHRLFAFQIVG